MVKSNKIYTPSKYLMGVTGNYYPMRSKNDIKYITHILNQYGYTELWDFPLNEIDHIVENNLDVILVDCNVYNETTKEFEPEYRWFEVPEDFDWEV